MKRFVTLVNRRACPDLDSSQVLVCGRLALLSEALREVRPESDVCVVACVSNFLCSSSTSGSSSVGLRVEPALLDFKAKILEACLANPDRYFMVHPPMYRSNPLWYRDGLAEVVKSFSSLMIKDRPTNLLMMPSFSSLSFEADGIHLTPYAGLEFIYFLFDSARDAIQFVSLDPSAQSSSAHEAGRVLHDRVTALEQDHQRLNKSFELKTAIYAERDDFQENVRNEVYFMLSGLRPIVGLRGKEWMDKAILEVQGVIRLLLGQELPIQVVHNASGRGRDAIVRYSVRMVNSTDSQKIRTKFGSFFIGGQDRRPESLRCVSISNKVTPGTQIRVMIMKLLAKRYSSANPDARVKVIAYESRPLMKITPPESSNDRRVKNFTFIEAIQRLPTQFTEAEVEPIISKARVHFSGSLRSTFVVLNDDAPRKSRQSRSAQSGTNEGFTRSSSAHGPAPVTDTEVIDDNTDADEASEAAVEEISVPTGSRKRPGSGQPGQPGSQRSRR